MIRTSVLITLAVVFSFILSSGSVAAQGGKAEPKRIEFAPGTSKAVLTGTLRNSQEMDFVFTAKKGREIELQNPSPSLFDFRVFDPDSGFDTEFDSSRVLRFALPEDADYRLFVRRKTGRPRYARFRISITIR